MKGVFLRKQKQQQFIRSLHFDLNVKGRPRSNNMQKQKRSLPPPPYLPSPPPRHSSAIPEMSDDSQSLN